MAYLKNVNEIDFQKQLNNFEQAMETDLAANKTAAAAKFQFDFSTGQPAQGPRKTINWVPLSAQDAPSRPVRRLELKPRMTFNLSAKDSSTPSFDLPFELAGRGEVNLNLPARFSNFGSSAKTESTMMDSTCNNSSIAGSVVGKTSLVDFNMSAGRRTSLVNTLKRKNTMQERVEEARESIESINDRGSLIEGTVNSPHAEVTQNKKTRISDFVCSGHSSSPDAPNSGRRFAHNKSFMNPED